MGQIHDEAFELLMMFINDGYSPSGKVSKKTALAMMRFVGKVDGLQYVVNGGCPSELIEFNIKAAMEQTK